MRLQKWLLDSKYDSAIRELEESCTCEDERRLVFELIERFSYITDADYETHLRSMIRKTLTDLQFPMDRTQIVASHISDDPDSSQALVQRLKPILAEMGFDKTLLLNRCTKATTYYESFPHILIVDEFVGTGSTMVNRIRQLQNDLVSTMKYRQKDVDVKLAAHSVAAMFEGAKKVISLGVPFDSELLMERGISDFYPLDQIEAKRRQMLRIESGLSPNYKGNPMPSFGYGGSEALYASQGQNIPNNVFPVFWWPICNLGRRRNTLFHRFEGK